ncbi:MAG TPA: hypothetical protein VMB50_01875 [Myxococcales bacterium]|nr:hypothetical protein [Myxococcales bacterium]
MLLAPLLLLACAAAPSAGKAAAGSDPDLTIDDDDDDAPPPPPIHDAGELPPPGRWDAPPKPPTPIGDVGPRLLAGIGLDLGFGQDRFGATTVQALAGATVVTGNPGGLGLDLRLGIQVNDHWGVEADLSAATIIRDSYARAALTLDYTPFDLVTLALGPVARGDADVLACSGATEDTAAVASVGGSARVDLHAHVARTAKGRSSFTLGLATDVGATIGASSFCGGARTYAGSAVGYAIYFTLGYLRY